MGCGNSGGESPQDEANAGETEQSSSQDEGWIPKTTLPDPD
ncbi:hypothetical protein RSSM_03353 [Rhodopirellula sallentina SM41]|uniref:Uncharacterized protein n=1 Tax=Rhodopirellula sallentina SM41 TaxID=1263870 RepID=M5UBK2_9BACT|nr:hypothetical protein RSSM_03353 [Rhodopirellula sallentina SM41]